jgi:hypothetical protein
MASIILLRRVPIEPPKWNGLRGELKVRIASERFYGSVDRRGIERRVSEYQGIDSDKINEYGRHGYREAV